MSRRPAKANEWVPLVIESWRKSTKRLSAEERGCYMELLLKYWETQSPLSYDESDFANLCNVSIERWRQIEPRILRYFDEKDGLLHNKKMDEDIEKNKSIAESRSKKHLDSIRPKTRRTISIGSNNRPRGKEWNQTRKLVFARDQYKCTYCGISCDAPHCDHIVPVSRGGSHTPDNLATSCQGCNLSKSDMTVYEWRASK